MSFAHSVQVYKTIIDLITALCHLLREFHVVAAPVAELLIARGLLKI